MLFSPFNLSVSSTARNRRRQAATPTPSEMPITAFNADGYSAVWADGTPPEFDPNNDPVIVPVTQGGYIQSGGAAVYSASALTDDVVIVNRRRQPAGPTTIDPTTPTGYAYTAAEVNLSDYIWSTSSLAGVTNNSANLPPPGVAQWGQCDRQMVGDTISGELTGGGITARDGRTFFAVLFTVSDGTNSVTQWVFDMAASTTGQDTTSTVVYVWQYSMNISGLADNANITVTAKCYPFIGGGGSILESTGTPGTRGFVPQVFRRNTARFAAPPLVYIDTATGNDATGAVSTNEATAKASPVATLNGAWARARAVLGTAAGSLDGLRIRGRAGTHELTTSPTANTVNAEVIFERDPDVPRASVTWGFGTANAHSNCNLFRVRDCMASRNGIYRMAVPTGGRLAIRDIDNLNNNSQTATLVGVALYIDGNVTITNPGSSNFNTTGTDELRMLRGVRWGNNGNQWAVEPWCIIGSVLRGCTLPISTTRTFDGAIIYSNLFLGLGGGSPVLGLGAVNDITGFMVAQNVFQWTSVTQSVLFGLSADGAAGDITGVICVNNTFIGAGAAGRVNLFYDESTAPRFHKFNLVENNIFSRLAHKNDIWHYEANGISDGRAGVWSHSNGCMTAGNITTFDNTTTAQEFAGLGTLIAPSQTVAVDMKFITYAGVTYIGGAYAVVAGDGDFRLASDSPAKGIGRRSFLPGGLDGLAGNALSAGAFR